MKNQSGQAVVEFILITMLIVSFATAMVLGVRNQAYVSELVNKPWQLLSGMIENGVWETPKKGKSLHPNYLRRGVSFKGDQE